MEVSQQIMVYALDIADAQQLMVQLQPCARPIVWAPSALALEACLKTADFVLVVISQEQALADGVRVKAIVQQVAPGLPVVVMGPLATAQERIEILELAVDDCIAIPVDPLEMVARFELLSKRSTRSDLLAIRASENVIAHADLEIWPSTKIAFANGRRIFLTNLEFDLLLCLMQNTSGPMAREQIIGSVFINGSAMSNSVVPVSIHRLRRKLEEAHCSLTVNAVRNKGYVLQQRPGFSASPGDHQ